MGMVTLMDFTCVVRPSGGSALSHDGLLCNIKGLASHGPVSFLTLC